MRLLFLVQILLFSFKGFALEEAEIIVHKPYTFQGGGITPKDVGNKPELLVRMADAYLDSQTTLYGSINSLVKLQGLNKKNLPEAARSKVYPFPGQFVLDYDPAEGEKDMIVGLVIVPRDGKEKIEFGSYSSDLQQAIDFSKRLFEESCAKLGISGIKFKGRLMYDDQD